VNVHRTDSDWNDYATDSGYKSMKDMLHHLYTVHRKSTKEVGVLLNVGKDRVAQLLRKHGVKVRPRGGAQ